VAVTVKKTELEEMMEGVNRRWEANDKARIRDWPEVERVVRQLLAAAAAHRSTIGYHSEESLRASWSLRDAEDTAKDLLRRVALYGLEPNKELSPR
jgi:hypothetical protein